MLRLPMRWRSPEWARNVIASQLKEQHFLRMHALALFAWTFGAGYLVSRLALGAGMTSLPTRYALTCMSGYLAFLLGVRIWLWHVGATDELSQRELGAGDVVNALDAASDLASLSADAISGAGDAVGGGVADGVGAAAGDGFLPILLIGLLVLALALIVGLIGPELLIEIAFEAVLAGSLVGAMRLGREPDWLWTACRKTLWIFFGILFVMLLFGRYAQKHYPNATTTRQVIHEMLQHGGDAPVPR
jgi:hypothetical protein